MVDQTFHAAEAGSHFDQFHVFNHAIGRFTRIVFEINRNHAADAFRHLCLGEFVMFMRRQAGIEHFFYGRMGFQTACDFECVLAMGVHAQGQRFDAAQHQPAVHRPCNRAGMHHHIVQRLSQLFGFGNDYAHQYVGMTAQIFGSGVEHKIATHIQRLLQIWRGKGVVDTHQRTGCFGFRGKGFDVYQAQKRIGRRFQPNQFDIARFEQLVQIIRIAQIGKNNVHTPFLINIDQ